MELRKFIATTIREYLNEYGIVLLYSEDESNIAVFKKDTLIENIDKLKKMILPSRFAKRREVIFGISTEKFLEAFKIKRSVSSFALYLLDDKYVSQLKDTLNVIESINN